MRSRLDPSGSALTGVAEIIMAKNRNGPTGDLTLRFTREYTRFDNFSAREEPAY